MLDLQFVLIVALAISAFFAGIFYQRSIHSAPNEAEDHRSTPADDVPPTPLKENSPFDEEFLSKYNGLLD